MPNRQSPYVLVTKLLGLASRYDRDAILGAKKYVSESFKGHEKRALTRMLNSLLDHVEGRDGIGQRHIKVQSFSVDDADEREVSAMLSDAAFIGSKKDMRSVLVPLGLLSRVLSTETRETAMRKALRALKAMSSGGRKRAIRQLRKLYLQRRGSTVRGWSDVFSS